MRSFLVLAACCGLFALMTCSFWGCGSSSKCPCCSDGSCEKAKKACPAKQIDTNIVITPKQTEEETMAKEKSDSGLEWEVLQEGTGENPDVGKTVTVHYTGWLEKDGQPDETKKFDSSVDRGQPFKFRIGVGMVIAGWDEGVMDMKVGEKRRLFIPADLAYGSRGAGSIIPPNAALIFDVELLDVA